MNHFKSILILSLLCLTAGCATQTSERRVPGFSNTVEAREALASYPPEKIGAVVSWFPTQMTGCPGWETVGLAGVDEEALVVWLGNWEHQILDIKIHGCPRPLTDLEARLLVDTVKDVYFPDRTMRVEYIEDEDWIQAAWLAVEGYNITPPPLGVPLAPQRLPLNRKVVDRFNRHMDEAFIDRIYVAMRVTYWEFY